MKNVIRLITIAFLFAAVSITYGAIPAISVTVSDASGKVAYKGTTAANGSFATGNLKPGNYTVQFNSTGAPKASPYTLVISAGKKKVSANAVTGERFAGGGVAMKIEVGSGINIKGQVSSEANARVSANGKKMVWIDRQLGSNIAGHWAEEDSAEAKQAKTAGSFSRQNIQDRQNQGVTPGG